MNMGRDWRPRSHYNRFNWLESAEGPALSSERCALLSNSADDVEEPVVVEDRVKLEEMVECA